MCLVRPSFVPPQPIRQRRDLTRYRTKVVREHIGEAQRLHSLVEDALLGRPVQALSLQQFSPHPVSATKRLCLR